MKSARITLSTGIGHFVRFPTPNQKLRDLHEVQLQAGATPRWSNSQGKNNIAQNTQIIFSSIKFILLIACHFSVHHAKCGDAQQQRQILIRPFAHTHTNSQRREMKKVQAPNGMNLCCGMMIELNMEECPAWAYTWLNWKSGCWRQRPHSNFT